MRVPAEVKVKEPQPAEFEYLREGQALFPYLDLAANRAVAGALRAAGTTG